MPKPPYPPEAVLNLEQAKRILQYIDASHSEAVKQSVFGQLGHDCFAMRKLAAWIDSFQGDVQAFLDHINVQQASKYWERLEFSADGRQLFLTGRPVSECACTFADCAQPPTALCQICCKSFQTEIFSRLLGQRVAVEITAAYLLGDDRCSTTVHLTAE